MKFLPKADNFSGLIKSFYDTGRPKIELNASEPSSDGRAAIKAIEYNNTDSHYVSNVKDGLNAYFIVKLSSPFCITHYTIRSHPNPMYYIRAWTFAASMDGINYHILDNKEKNDYLKDNRSFREKVNPQRKKYKHFRIMQTVMNSDILMRISGIDLFGTFTLENEKRRKINFSKIIKFVYIFVIKTS